MIFSYDKYITLINEKIDEYGGYVNYHYQVDGAINAITGLTTYNNITVPVKVIVAPYSNELIDGDNIRKGDKQVFIKSTVGKPSLDDNIEIDGEYFKIIRVKDFAPGVNDILVYALQVRSYEAVVSAIDVLKVALSTLELGMIVKDSFALDTSPQWRVIAQSHHSNNVTTLLCDKVWENYSFDGTAEGGGYYPDMPWAYSYMRYRLNNYFMETYFSAELQGILMVIELETQDNLYNDKVSLLSKEELYDVEEGSSSGSYISYFSTDAYRVGRWYSDDTPMRYWTREVYTWVAPDGVIKTVDSDGDSGTFPGDRRSGVRPIIFLPDTVNVVLNPDGKYSIDY